MRTPHEHRGTVKIRLLTTLALTLSVSLAPVARSDDQSPWYHVKEYQETRVAGGEKWHQLEIYIQGLGDGIDWASRVSRKEPKLLYCPNAKQPLYLYDYLSALEKEIEISKPNGDEWIGGLLVSGLIKMFPCEGKQ